MCLDNARMFENILLNIYVHKMYPNKGGEFALKICMFAISATSPLSVPTLINPPWRLLVLLWLQQITCVINKSFKSLNKIYHKLFIVCS